MGNNSAAASKVTSLKKKTPLMEATETGDVDSVSLLLENGADAQTVDINGISALHIAAEKGNESIVKLLIDKGNVDVNSIGKSRRTALHLAAHFDHIGLAKLLLKAKAKLNIQDIKGKTPLHLSAELKGSGIEMCTLLINAGADPTITADDDTALDFMSKQKRLSFLSQWVQDHCQKKEKHTLLKMLEAHHFALWFAIAKVEEPTATNGAQEFKILSQFVQYMTMKHGWKVVEEAKDVQGRTAYESASKAMRGTMEKVLLWHGQYRTDKKPVAEYNSATYEQQCILPISDTFLYS